MITMLDPPAFRWRDLADADQRRTGPPEAMIRSYRTVRESETHVKTLLPPPPIGPGQRVAGRGRFVFGPDFYREPLRDDGSARPSSDVARDLAS
jgi:hypothetical protein